DGGYEVHDRPLGRGRRGPGCRRSRWRGACRSTGGLRLSKSRSKQESNDYRRGDCGGSCSNPLPRQGPLLRVHHPALGLAISSLRLLMPSSTLVSMPPSLVSRAASLCSTVPVVFTSPIAAVCVSMACKRPLTLVACVAIRLRS